MTIRRWPCGQKLLVLLLCWRRMASIGAWRRTGWRWLQRRLSHQGSAPAEKVALFRRLFRGRTDVYPVRWESKRPASRLRAGLRQRVAAGSARSRASSAATAATAADPAVGCGLYDHLAGQHTVGVYPLLEDDTCHFLAVDFDEAEWQRGRPGLHASRVASWACRPRWKFRALARARMPGCSSPAACRHGMPAAWVRPSSATPARAPGSSSWRPTTACFPTRTRCPKVGSAT